MGWGGGLGGLENICPGTVPHNRAVLEARGALGNGQYVRRPPPRPPSSPPPPPYGPYLEG